MSREAVSYVPQEVAQAQLRVVQPVDNISDFQAYKEQHGVSQFFPDISSESIKEYVPTERDRHVGLHEFFHSYAAHTLNMYVDHFTIEPKQGEYEGVTRLKGPFNIEHYQIVGAAGAAATDMQGAGSDFAMIRRLSEKYGGMSPEQALVSAKSIVSTISSEEREVIARLIVLKGRTIYGHEIPALIARAREEVGTGRTVQDIQYAEHTRELQQISDKNPDAPVVEIITRIENEEVVEEIGEGLTAKYKKVNGEIQEESINVTCMFCRMTNGHAVDCKNNDFHIQNVSSISRRQSLKPYVTHHNRK